MLKPSKTRRFAVTLAATALTAGGLIAGTAGTASADSSCGYPSDQGAYAWYMNPCIHLQGGGTSYHSIYAEQHLSGGNTDIRSFIELWTYCGGYWHIAASDDNVYRTPGGYVITTATAACSTPTYWFARGWINESNVPHEWSQSDPIYW